MDGETYFKISFLRAMASSMTKPDLEIYLEVSRRFAEGTAVLADLNLLDQLYKKFDRPAGNERI